MTYAILQILLFAVGTVSGIVAFVYPRGKPQKPLARWQRCWIGLVLLAGAIGIGSVITQVAEAKAATAKADAEHADLLRQSRKASTPLGEFTVSVDLTARCSSTLWSPYVKRLSKQSPQYFLSSNQMWADSAQSPTLIPNWQLPGEFELASSMIYIWVYCGRSMAEVRTMHFTAGYRSDLELALSFAPHVPNEGLVVHVYPDSTARAFLRNRDPWIQTRSQNLSSLLDFQGSIVVVWVPDFDRDHILDSVNTLEFHTGSAQALSVLNFTPLEMDSCTFWVAMVPNKAEWR